MVGVALIAAAYASEQLIQSFEIIYFLQQCAACVTCLQTTKDDSNYFSRNEWAPKVEHVVRRYNVQHKLLVSVDSKSVYLSPLQR